MSLGAPGVKDALDSVPGEGRAVDVAPGVKWLRLPLPFQLDHINIWLLEDAGGWAIVDTGIFTRTTRAIWQRVFQQELDHAPVTKVLVTHLHPDHVGCAGWLARKFETELWMTRTEYLLCRVLVADTGKPAPPEGVGFYAAAGFSPEAIGRYEANFGSFGRVVAPMPNAYRRLYEGQRLTVGRQSWEVLIGRGHSPEHACFFCRELNLLISGDQILPAISPNVSVYPTEPRANPLLHWFESLHRLKERLPEDVLVLPAHGKPFRGVNARLDQLREEHDAGLAKLRDLCRKPHRPIDVFPALFKNPVNHSNLMLATGEAIAHLNYLVENGEMAREADAAGVNWYRMVAR